MSLTTAHAQTADAPRSPSHATVAPPYETMPREVQLKMDENKAAGKDLLDGVLKVFTVKIPACKTVFDCKSQLRFLNNADGFVRIEFVSEGMVHLIVEPSFDSVSLKELMKQHGIEFVFVNQYYLLKN